MSVFSKTNKVDIFAQSEPLIVIILDTLLRNNMQRAVKQHLDTYHLIMKFSLVAIENVSRETPGNIPIALV